MKNVHLIPTDKPSRLSILNSGKLNFGAEIMSSSNSKPQHIYITSDEEIKEGVDQWYLDKVLNKPYNSGGAQYSSKQDVIILTTDQDLINDGVQAIDDDFLEWFVKNPSCEGVEIKKVFDEDWSEISGAFEISYYKIIIPKEEPEQDLPIVNGSYGCTIQTKKEETLEEVAEKYINSKNPQWTPYHRQSFKDGAKWQQERMYSEEEVKMLAFNFYYDMSHKMGVAENLISENRLNAEEWFEQFKKHKGGEQ